MALTRAKTKRQLRHSGSRSKSHLEDKFQGELRGRTHWVSVEALAPSPHERDMSAVPAWELRQDEQGRWVRCVTAEEFADYVEAQHKRRGWFSDTVTRKGKRCPMRRKVDAPMEILTVSFPPWLSDWTHQHLQRGVVPRELLAEITRSFLVDADRLLAGKRFLCGVAFHADTSDPHFDLVLSRYDGRGARIGDPGLELCGPWSTGVDRQLRAGAAIGAEKRSRYNANVRKHRLRYGTSAVPLDVQLARSLDARAEEVVPELERYRLQYGEQVPEIEQGHLARAAAKAEAIADRLRSLCRAQSQPQQLHQPEISR